MLHTEHPGSHPSHLEVVSLRTVPNGHDVKHYPAYNNDLPKDASHLVQKLVEDLHSEQGD